VGPYTLHEVSFRTIDFTSSSSNEQAIEVSAAVKKSDSSKEILNPSQKAPNKRCALIRNILGSTITERRLPEWTSLRITMYYRQVVSSNLEILRILALDHWRWMPNPSGSQWPIWQESSFSNELSPKLDPYTVTNKRLPCRITLGHTMFSWSSGRMRRSSSKKRTKLIAFVKTSRCTNHLPQGFLEIGAMSLLVPHLIFPQPTSLPSKRDRAIFSFNTNYNNAWILKVFFHRGLQSFLQ
jgi:hypothetical protein